MAFVQHMIYQLSEEGTMAVVLPHGVLYRGSAESNIRKYIIEQVNYLDAVIGLPSNMFYGASIATCVLIFKKCRKNPGDILFIDASQYFDKIKTTNVMGPNHIQKIIDTYKARISEEKYSNAVSIDIIKANDFNLNISRYVDIFEVDKEIDLAEISKEIRNIEIQSRKTDSVIESFCKELKIAPPFEAES
jgi:type I restriction enzyme M protein